MKLCRGAEEAITSPGSAPSGTSQPLPLWRVNSLPPPSPNRQHQDLAPFERAPELTKRLCWPAVHDDRKIRRASNTTNRKQPRCHIRVKVWVQLSTPVSNRPSVSIWARNGRDIPWQNRVTRRGSSCPRLARREAASNHQQQRVSITEERKDVVATRPAR